MSVYNIMYINDLDKIIKSETVFMKCLRGAKVSSSSYAPFFTVKI